MDSENDNDEFINKIKQLRKIQTQMAKIEGDLTYDLLNLESKYETKLAPFYERRRQIVCGEYEPKLIETKFPLTYVNIPDTGEKGVPGTRGIPGFWLIIFNNIPLLWSMIQRQDINPLSHLIDITCTRNTTNKRKPGFRLEFYFEPNKFFKNDVLTKEYVLSFGKKKNDPFNSFGPELVSCTGCEIDWKEQDLTLTINKNKTIKRASLFNFFDPPELSDDPDLQPYILNYLLTDFQIGYYIKDKVIPNAVLYYLGEAVLRESFGFDPQYMETQNIESLDEPWPVASRVNRPQENETNTSGTSYNVENTHKWEQSEKLLAERLKRKLEKSESYEKSKVKVDNLAAKLSNASEKVKNKKLELIKRTVKGYEMNTIVPKTNLNLQTGIITEETQKFGNKKIRKPVMKATTSDNINTEKIRKDLVTILKAKQVKNEPPSKEKVKPKPRSKLKL